jgi:hypothetical protein
MIASRFRPALLLLGLGALLLAGCSDSTLPDAEGGLLGSAFLEGNLDPATGDFVLKTLDVPTPDGPPVRIQLIGSEMTTDPEAGTVDIMVAVRSRHDEPLYPPVTIWLDSFQPEQATVLNPDFLLPVYGPDGSPTGAAVFGFDYSELLGEDGVLGPGEATAARLWRFESPGLQPFAFGARGEFGLAPDLARLGGLCFHDENRDGVHQPDEPPLPHGVVHVATPGGEVFETWVQEDGRYALHVFEAGLYTVHYDPMIDTFAPIAWSTPNPRQVIITADADGHLQSFFDADFGMYTDLPPGPPPIRFTDLPPDSLHFELWNLIGAEIADHHLLQLEVGYSGCQPEHPFSLWMSGGFMESMPVQANIVPVHELAEDCDAAFTGARVFNLWPLRERFLEAYGPGVLLLNIIDFDGEATQLEWPIFPPD